MTPTNRLLLLWLACLVGVVGLVTAQEAQREPDRICKLLFDTYVARRGKVNTETVMAASHIIAERGRNNGFWRDVLRELQEGNDESEIGCVRILGEMLSVDALARDVIQREKETGEVGQWFASVCLGGEVVDELISRGRKADRFRLEHYVIALAWARVPEAADFFRTILADDDGKHYTLTAKFHAALGLAQLGQPDGYEWLIAKSSESPGTVAMAWPSGISGSNLGTCCGAALQHLAGPEGLTDPADWKKWRGQADKDSLPKGPVDIVEP